MKGGESWVQGADPRYPHHCGKTFLARSYLGLLPLRSLRTPASESQGFAIPVALHPLDAQCSEPGGYWQLEVQPTQTGAREGLSEFPRKHGHRGLLLGLYSTFGVNGGSSFSGPVITEILFFFLFLLLFFFFFFVTIGQFLPTGRY